uniref:Uncharacterized protein n=1 Tax=Aegilops tauschii subsp. strangulata TaxID=200361 RepID=A0A453PCT9_AEGTS
REGRIPPALARVHARQVFVSTPVGAQVWPPLFWRSFRMRPPEMRLSRIVRRRPYATGSVCEDATAMVSSGLTTNVVHEVTCATEPIVSCRNNGFVFLYKVFLVFEIRSRRWIILYFIFQNPAKPGWQSQAQSKLAAATAFFTRCTIASNRSEHCYI